MTGVMDGRTGVARRRVMAGLAALPLAARASQAQRAFPERPVRLVVPYGPGTATDALARQIAAAMPALLGQPMIVENRPGANAILGAEAVARSAPDGYTLILATDQVMCFNPALFARLPYAVRDFAPVAGLTSHPHILVVTPGLPARSVAELVALAKAQPGRLSFASTGVGTATHLVGETFQREAGIELTHVPYTGGGQLFADLLTGTVSMLFYPYQPLKPHLEAGRLRALANGSPDRAGWLPDLPTMPELGYPRSIIAAWLAVYAPAGTPEDRVNRLSQAFQQALNSPEIRGALMANGIDIRSRPPSDLAAFTASEADRCRAVVQQSGARVE